MKNKMEIVGIRIGIDNYGHEYFDEFQVKDANGNRFFVDALVSGSFTNEVDDLVADEQIDWAKKQVGKFLFCDDLSAMSFNAIGKVYIV